MFLTTLNKRSLGESAAAATTLRTLPSFSGVLQCAEDNSEGILRFQSHVSCIRSAEALLPELVLVRHLAINYMWNYHGENPLFAEEWRAPKGKASLTRLFPCDAAAAASSRTPGWQQQLQQHRCPTCPVPHPSWGMLDTDRVTVKLESPDG